MKKLTPEELDVLVHRVVVKMEYQSFQSICDELGRSHSSIRQALSRRGLFISRIKYNYKNGISNVT